MEQPTKLKWLLMAWAFACLLFASWLFPATRALWDQLDSGTFYLLNGSLASGKTWQIFWAVTNWRPFDTIAALLILIVSFSWIYKSPLSDRLNHLSGLTLLLVMIIATRLVVAAILQAVDYDRFSPSIVLQPSIRLNAMFDWIETKDYHKHSFPGDHGYVVISTIAFFFIKAGKRWGYTALILFTPFMIPRLVSGAHWLTDILIGSTTMVLISLPLLMATPIYRLGQNGLYRILNKLFAPLLRLFRLI